MFSKQLSLKLKEVDEKDRDPELQKNANKYDKIMRSLSIKRDNSANKRIKFDIIQNFNETKLYIPPVNSDDLSPKQPQKSKSSSKTAEIEIVEVNINQLLNEIIECLKDNCSNWFTNSNLLKQLIPKALQYVDYNLKRNNNYIFEFESLLRASQQTQENDLLKNNQQLNAENIVSSKPVVTNTPVQVTKESKKRSKSLKIISRSSNNDKSGPSSPVATPKLSEVNGVSESYLTDINSSSHVNILNAELSKLQLPNNSLGNYLNDLRQQQAVQLTYHHIEQNIMQIGYCLNTLNRFWSKFLTNLDPNVFDDHLSLFYINNSDNLNAFSKIEHFLYDINWQLTNKNIDDQNDLDATSFTTDLHSILLTPTTNKNLLNINFLLNYYKLISYDFISFKLFIRQIHLIQIAAILCQIVYRILNFYQKFSRNNLQQQQQQNNMNSKDFLIFPTSQYRPISWSNTHVTLHHQNLKPPGTPTTAVSTTHQSLSTSQTSLGPQTMLTRPVSPSHNVKQEQENSINNLFILELKDFLNLSINRLNNQADIINNIGYFYIVNKTTGLVLEAFEQSGNTTTTTTTSSTNNTLSPRASVNLKSKAARFYLTKKEKGRGEQLWYYYAYNGCIANKLVRSGHCMAVSSLNPKSPVCLFPNVRTTNCRWFFNSVDNTIISGLGENLVLDYTNDDEANLDATFNNNNKRYAVIINKKEVNKASQKWSFEFI